MAETIKYQPGATEDKRFRPREESLAIMRDIDTKLEEIKQKKPTIRGIGFFGSRVLGAEKEESDLDIVIFYDSQIQKRTQTGFTTSSIKKDFNVGKRLGTHLAGPVDFTWEEFFSLDIAHSSLDKKIHGLVEKTNKLTDNLKQTIDIAQFEGLFTGHDALEFASLFFLAVGEPVYQARKYVLDQLEKLPNGGAYFAILMRVLSYYEREVSKKRQMPVYAHYPKTITEARKYFIVHDHPEQPDHLAPEVDDFCKSHRVGIAIKKAMSKLKNKVIDSMIGD